MKKRKQTKAKAKAKARAKSKAPARMSAASTLLLMLEATLRSLKESAHAPSSPPVPAVAGPHHPDKIVIFRSPSGFFAVEGSCQDHSLFQLIFETYEEASFVAVNMARNMGARVLSAQVSWFALDSGQIVPMFGEIAPVYPINLARAPSRNLC